VSTVRTHAPAKDFRWYRRRILRAAIVVVAGLLLFYSKLTFDLTPWAQAVTSALTTWNYGEEGYDDTRVLLFTEGDLQFARGRFPIAYETHAVILEILKDPATRPRALFIDFAFVQPEKKDDRGFAKLKDAVCALHALIPVFVVDTRSLDGTPAAEDRESPFDTCAQAVGAFVDEEEPGAGLMSYPACGMPPADKGSVWLRLKALFVADHEPCEGPLSAAYALWKIRTPTAAEGVLREDRMALVWPARYRSQELCAQDRGIGSIGHTIADLYLEGAEAFKRRCPYTRTVTVGQLLNPEASAASAAGDLKGRTVLYGGKIAFSGDLLKSPVYKDFAGVYYHAMAYDNLITLEGRAKNRETPHWLKNLIALALSLVATWMAFHHHHEAPKADPAKKLRFYALVVGSFVVFSIVVLGITVAMSDRAPEYLIASCLFFYFFVRVLTDRSAAFKSLLCFVFALAMFFFFAISVDIFFSMILFLEVVHLMLHHLTAAAENVHSVAATTRGPAWSRERIALALLDPFMPD